MLILRRALPCSGSSISCLPPPLLPQLFISCFLPFCSIFFLIHPWPQETPSLLSRNGRGGRCLLDKMPGFLLALSLALVYRLCLVGFSPLCLAVRSSAVLPTTLSLCSSSFIPTGCIRWCVLVTSPHQHGDLASAVKDIACSIKPISLFNAADSFHWPALQKSKNISSCTFLYVQKKMTFSFPFSPRFHHWRMPVILQTGDTYKKGKWMEKAFRALPKCEHQCLSLSKAEGRGVFAYRGKSVILQILHGKKGNTHALCSSWVLVAREFYVSLSPKCIEMEQKRVVRVRNPEFSS